MSFRDKLEDHLWLSMTLAMLSLTATLVLGFFIFYFQTEGNNLRHAQEKARQAAVQTIETPICTLVYVYEHLDPNTPNSKLVIRGWEGIGKAAGCPKGVIPEGN